MVDSQTTPVSNDPARPREAVARWWSRWLASTGLQGKIVCCFMALLLITVAFTYWMYALQTDTLLSNVMGEQANGIARLVALAGDTAIDEQDATRLKAIEKHTLENGDVLSVTFFDAEGNILSSTARDARFGSHEAPALGIPTPSMLLRPEHGYSALTGPYLRVITPVVRTTADGPSRLIGYVRLYVSEARGQARLAHISALLLAMGVFAAVYSLPVIYLLVHRIFQPIRQLVGATNRIAAGDLDTNVGIHRRDEIGTLARSFNEMTQTVKRQQHALKEANEKLADANAGLEQKVQERTGQLEIANKRLSSEIAEKEDFLRAVSHDLNAPLRNISGMAAVLLAKSRDKFDEDVIHRLERIQKNVEVETDLIGELLELSRIKTRRQRMEIIDTGALVRELRDVFEQDLSSKRIELTIDDSMPAMECERLRMRQLFQNLIDNAIKYMGDGPTREIHVGCRVRTNEAEFFVRDTGIGIDRDDLGKVFFVFRRGKSQAVQSVAGKGIGLASAKSIVETYSGTIWVESEAGRGSTFKFTINGKYFPTVARHAPESSMQLAGANQAA